MEFDTNKKLVAFIAIGAIVSYMLFQGESPKRVDKVKKEDIKTKVKKEDISILYLDKSDEQSHVNTIVHSQIKPSQTTVYEETDALATFYDDGDKIKQYIEEKHLVNLTQNSNTGSEPIKSRYSVYADISQKDALQNRDKALPPMAPTIIHGVFTSGSPYTVVVDSSVKKQATKIIVTDNNPDGTIQEAVQIPQKTSSYAQETSFTAPPAIGQ